MKKGIYIILILVIVGIALVYINDSEKDSRNNVPEVEYVSYGNSEYGPGFTYPKSWGEVALERGTQTCPEEDTYFTADTLKVFDWKYSFPEMKLPDSESFIRTGVRTYELDPEQLNDCGDEFLLRIANKEVLPEELSSAGLDFFVNERGLEGVYSPKVSRLDTESRTQYTFFLESNVSDIIYIVQPFTSFIPTSASPELAEIENEFEKNINEYIAEGETSAVVRGHLENFRKMVESLTFWIE